MSANAVLIATTMLYRDNIDRTPYVQHPFPSDVETVLAADELAELAGRASSDEDDIARSLCDPRTNYTYLRSALLSGDESPFEHASATFYVSDISRALTHELKSNRDLVFSELSSRVCASDYGYVTPPAFRGNDATEEQLEEFHDDCMILYDSLVDRGQRNGLSVTEARDAARAVVPNCQETAIVVTGTMRVWREVIGRLNTADAEAREFAGIVLMALRDVAPNTFQDMRAPLRLVRDDEPEPVAAAV